MAEQLKYVSAIGTEIIFSETSKYKWTNADDLGSNSATFQTISSPFQDGTSLVGDVYFESKEITVEFYIISNDLIGDFRSLNQILNPKLGVGRLEYTRGGVTYVLDQVNAKVMPSLPGLEDRGLTYQKSAVIFEVFNPLYSDQNFTLSVVGTGQNLFKFPLRITDEFKFGTLNTSGVILNNIGDVPAPIKVVIPGAVSAPLTIENTTTGEKIVLGLDLTSDEILTITTDVTNTNVIKYTISTDTDEVAFNYIDITQTTFFRLASGNNTILVTSGGGDIVGTEVSYKNYYVGV